MPRLMRCARSRLILFSFFFATASLGARPLKVLVTTVPESLHPAGTLFVGRALALRQTFEMLYDYDSANNLIPKLAAAHRILDDGKRIVVELRRDRFFSDGSPMTAQDVVNSLQDTANRIREGSRYAFGYLAGFENFVQGKAKRIAGIRAIDSHTVEFQLTKNYHLFLPTLTKVDFGILKTVNGQHLGTGPYKLVSSTKDLYKVTLVDLYRKTPGIATDIEFIRVDAHAPPPPGFDMRESNIKPAELPGYNTVPIEFLQTVTLDLDPTVAPFQTADNRCYFASRLRQELQKSEYELVGVADGLPFFRDAMQVSAPAPKVDAKRPPLKINLMYSGSVAWFTKSRVEQIIRNLKSQNIDLTMTRMEISELVKGMQKNTIHAALTGYIPDYIDIDAIFTPLLGKDQLFNHANTQHKGLEKLLEKGRLTIDMKSRSEIYKEVMGVVNRECILQFLGTQPAYAHVSKRLQMPKPSGLGFHHINLQDVKVLSE